MEFDPALYANSILDLIKKEANIEDLDQDQLFAEIKQNSIIATTESHIQVQVSTSQTQNQSINKNIEDLKQIPKTRENFDKIYEIFQRIATEKDIYAMSYGVREGFVYVTANDKTYTNIFSHAVLDNKQDLIRLLIESGIRNNLRN